MSQLHVRFDGQSWDFDMEELDLGDLSSDADIRRAAAEALDAPVAKLQNFAIEKSDDGDVTLRPQAVFGE
jgi:hypothetical protein